MQAHDQKRREHQEQPAPRRTSRAAAGPLAQMEAAANQGPGARQTLRLRKVIQGVFEKADFLEALRKQDPKRALALLEGAELHELGNTMIQAGADNSISQEALTYLYTNASKSAAKLGAWQAFAYRRGNLSVAAAAEKGRVPEGKLDALRGGIYEDVGSGGEYLREEIEKIQKGIGPFKDYRSRGIVEDFDKIFLQARELELQQGVSVRAAKPSHLRELGSEYQTFSSGELTTLESVLKRLPRSHVADNPQLEFFQRQPRHPSFKLRGAEYSKGERRVNVFDDTFTGPYRATGETSYLGQHDKEHPLTPGEEALTHEIGHSVDARFPEVAADFAQAAGWERFADGEEVKGALLTSGAEDIEAQSLIDGLNQERALETRQRVFHGGFEYMVDPDDGHKKAFYRRRLNRMPGDPRTPESGFSHMDYARTSPKEHFAEMYAHMVHVPERTYQDYVQGPEQREMAARKLYLDLVEAAQQDETQEGARDSAEARYHEAKAQREALGRQWDVMREGIFGVGDELVSKEIPRLRKNAQKNGLDPNAAEANLMARAREAATPRQIFWLAASIFNEMLAQKGKE